MMNWISFKEEAPCAYQTVLVVKRYLDAPINPETGSYDDGKSFWTKPIVMIDFIIHDNGDLRWDKGGKAIYWLHIPKIPNVLE